MVGRKEELQRKLDGLVIEDQKLQKDENRVALLGVMAGIPGSQLKKDFRFIHRRQSERRTEIIRLSERLKEKKNNI